jgi:hypothetical protein
VRIGAVVLNETSVWSRALDVRLLIDTSVWSAQKGKKKERSETPPPHKKQKSGESASGTVSERL